MTNNTLNSKQTLEVNGKSYDYYNIKSAGEAIGKDLSRLPFSMKVILENLLRFEDGTSVTIDDIKSISQWLDDKTSTEEIAYRPARVLMQDLTGVPAVVDLAVMRNAVVDLGGDAEKINPLSPVDLVIDHSVNVDNAGKSDSFSKNVEIEMKRNQERYEFLKWGQGAFSNFRVVPPGTGICHQVNLEYLAEVVWTKEVDGRTLAYPDTCVGTDSHTTMINALAVLGWGVGGIEAEAAMLGQPISMLLPEVIGFKLKGKLKEGTTATDLVLLITQMLRERGVVGKFVEFFGEGMDNLSLADRATISNMAPEYGATCGFFPIDNETIKYLKLSSRPHQTIALVEAYAKEQGMWRDADTPDPIFTDVLELDISTVEPAIAGPKRPQDRILLSDAANSYRGLEKELHNSELKSNINVKNKDFTLSDGDIVIAAITSCTNTSNPSVMIAAGLVAKKALEKGLSVKPWVKTSLAPGSKVVTEYLEAANLQDDMDRLGFNLVGYGCTTCIGNSGPLDENIDKTIRDNDIIVTSVLSGNRNFEGRVHPLTKGNYLMSPPLVVAYSLAGSMTIDICNDALGQDSDGNDVFLKDIWPSNDEVTEYVNRCVTSDMFHKEYADAFTGTEAWQAVETAQSVTFPWVSDSTYIRKPAFFDNMTMDLPSLSDVKGANILALLGDSITTDHISPAGAIAKDGPAASYLRDNGIDDKDFNSFGSRRGNHEVMVRGTFANIRIKNEMANGREGGYTSYIPTGEIMPIYDAAMKYKENNTPLVVIGGNDYGMGSSRDWAAKGTILLGVKAVIVESFERIHRSNLVGMGVLPLVFKDGMNRKSLNFDGTETIDITGIESGITPKMDVNCTITRQDGSQKNINLLCRIDTLDEVEYYNNGGILHNVIRNLLK